MKDLRDFIAAGKTYEDICRCSVEWRPPESPQEQQQQAEQAATALEQEICRALQIDVLGRMEDGSVKIFSTFHRRSSVIRQPSRMSYEDFLQQCGPPAKACLLKSSVDDNIPGMYGVYAARSAVQLLASYRTLADETELGCGCWQASVYDEGKDIEDQDGSKQDADAVVIVNPSEAAVYNGHLTRVESPRACGLLLDLSVTGKPWYRFDGLQQNIERAADREFRMTVYRESAELFGRWRWAFQEPSPVILTGLCLATWIQHVWTWRPQVAIIGPSKSGKSMLCDALAGVFRGNCILTTDTTAAGLRQTIENSMPTVIVDEADPKDKSQQMERRKILGMIRQASRGGLVLRGSSHQHGIKHTLRHLFWIMGIQLPFTDEADRNRVIMLELKLPKPADEGKLHIPRPAVLRDLGQRMLAVALWASQRARRLAECIRDCRIEGIDSRSIESYAVPAAALAVVHGFEQSEPDVRGLLKEMLEEASTSDQATPQHDELMMDILAAKIQIAGERPTVAQCIERVTSHSTGAGEAEINLASVGIKIRGFGSSRSLVLQYRPVLTHLLRGGRWDGQAIDQIFRTIPGAAKSRLRVGGTINRGIELPWDIVEERYLGFEVVDETPPGGRERF